MSLCLLDPNYLVRVGSLGLAPNPSIFFVSLMQGTRHTGHMPHLRADLGDKDATQNRFRLFS
jgi:hypothetical protein